MKDKILNKMTLIAILICLYCNAQTSDFIVTTSKDTIYVDKINLTDFEVKTKTVDKKEKYKIDEIISYYIFKENKYYERIPLDKKELKEPNKYDYRRNEDFHIEKYDNRIRYKFIRRLTSGKIKLFIEVSTAYYMSEFNSPSQLAIPAPAYKNETCYISVYDSKLELLSDDGKLKLTKDVYELLKIYLYNNNKITKQLDELFISKPIANKEQIINLINEYNIWANSNK